MSRWPGRLITKTPVTPGGSAPNATAPGVWTLPEMAYWKKQGLWPDASADAYWGYVSYLMATSSLSNASNNLFVDSSGAFSPVSRVGNTTQGAVTPYGTLWSNYFDGSSYITMASGTAAGTGDFTIEGWFNLSSYSTGPGLYDTRPNSTNGAYPAVLFDTSGYLAYYVNGAIQIQGTTLVGLNTWNHFALCRSGTSTRLFLNGVQQGSTYSDTNNYLMGGSRPIIGGNGYVPGGASQLTGYLSNIRVVNGTALYTTAFTPPTSPLTAISGTVLLTCQSNRFRDASTNNVAVNVSGAARVTPYAPFVLNSPGAVYNQSDISYWSGYFDGTSDSLSYTGGSSIAFGTGDFTIELWAYLTNTGTYSPFLRPDDSGVFPEFGYDFGTGQLKFDARNGAIVAVTTTMPTAQWVHLAACRSGTNLRLFVNGSQVGTTTTNSTNFGTTTGIIRLGGSSFSASHTVNGYLSNFRVINGTALYTGNFTPPTAPLTAVSNTSLLTCQNAAFTDNSTNNFIITANGNATVTGNNPYQAGYYSNYFDGSGDFLTAPASASWIFSGDYTLEAWVYPTASGADMQISGTGGSGSNDQFGITSGVGTGRVYWAYNAVGNYLTTTATIPANAWTHIAVTRSSNTLRAFVNGVQVFSGTMSTTVGQNATNYIGRRSDGFNSFTGYMSNLRLINGTAVYTSAFTPPTTPLTAITNTSLLTCQANRLIDSSANSFTLTKNGDVAVSPFDPFYTATVASNGGSMYFDGTGDYLTAPSSDLYRVDTGDWTMEAWLYVTSTGSNYTFLNRGVYLSTYSFYFGTSGSSLYYEAGAGGWSTSATYTSSSGAIVPGQWNHVAAVRSGTSLLLYANGNRVLNQASASFGANVTAPLQIGAYLSGTATVNGNLTDVRFTQGTALYTGATYTIPTAPLTPSANTTLLLNGMNAGTYDAAMQNNLETVGNARVASAQAKYGTTSAYIPDATSLLKGPLTQNTAFGTGDFTVEAWIYSVATTSGYTCIFTSRDGVTSQANTVFFGLKPNTNQLTFYTSSEIIGTSTAVSTGVWTHVALVRNSGATAIYINGTSAGTATFTTALTGTGLAIGNEYSLASSNGGLYVDDLRITKGYARYTANFTPPTAALPIY